MIQLQQVKVLGCDSWLARYILMPLAQHPEQVACIYHMYVSSKPSATRNFHMCRYLT